MPGPQIVLGTVVNVNNGRTFASPGTPLASVMQPVAVLRTRTVYVEVPVRLDAVAVVANAVPLTVAPLYHSKANVPAPADANRLPLSAPPVQFVEGVGVIVTVGRTVLSSTSAVTGVDVQFVLTFVTVAE